MTVLSCQQGHFLVLVATSASNDTAEIRLGIGDDVIDLLGSVPFCCDVFQLEGGPVDHHDLFLATVGGQPLHHPGEDPDLSPLFPPVVEGLGRSLLPQGVAPPQPNRTEDYQPVQHAPVIDPRLAVALREERLQPPHLGVSQPERVAHRATRQRAVSDPRRGERPEADQWVLTLELALF